jgi:peptidoglycan hydrolase CwlO-like protein
MTPLFIQLAQSVTGAVITIVALLLVAAIIGCLTAWFYAKSVYTPVIKGLESDKNELNNQVAGLKNEKDKLSGKVDKLNEKIARLEEKIAEIDKELKSRKNPKK